MINKKELKKRIKERKMKIGKEALTTLIKLFEKDILKRLDFIERNLRITGRKIIKQDDFKD